jgi:transposase-like protein
MTEVGHLDLEVPRDRSGTFEPQTVRKGQRRLDGVDKLVMGLYARGMTVRDLQAQLKETFDLDVSQISSPKSPTGSWRRSGSGCPGPWTGLGARTCD